MNALHVHENVFGNVLLMRALLESRRPIPRAVLTCLVAVSWGWPTARTSMSVQGWPGLPAPDRMRRLTLAMALSPAPGGRGPAGSRPGPG